MRTILILLLSLCSTTIAAQESQYEEMKQSLDEHSLPLVNMIVDIGGVNKNTFYFGISTSQSYSNNANFG